MKGAIGMKIEDKFIEIDKIINELETNEVSLEDNTCKIKYESIYEIKKINIDPDTVTIEK